MTFVTLISKVHFIKYYCLPTLFDKEPNEKFEFGINGALKEDVQQLFLNINMCYTIKGDYNEYWNRYRWCSY